MVIDDDIMAMSAVHLASLGTKLVQLNPVLLCRLPMEVSCILEISAGVHVHTRFLMILNVDGGDDAPSLGDDSKKVRETLGEALQKFDEVTASYIVRKNKVARSEMSESHLRDVKTPV